MLGVNATHALADRGTKHPNEMPRGSPRMSIRQPHREHRLARLLRYRFLMSEIQDPLTERIIGCAIEVHRATGPGLLESVYDACLAVEMASAGLEFRRQVSVPLEYKTLSVQTAFRVDLVIEDRVPGPQSAGPNLYEVNGAEHGIANQFQRDRSACRRAAIVLDQTRG